MGCSKIVVSLSRWMEIDAFSQERNSALRVSLHCEASTHVKLWAPVFRILCHERLYFRLSSAEALSGELSFNTFTACVEAFALILSQFFDCQEIRFTSVDERPECAEDLMRVVIRPLYIEWLPI